MTGERVGRGPNVNRRADIVFLKINEEKRRKDEKIQNRKEKNEYEFERDEEVTKKKVFLLWWLRLQQLTPT